MVHHGQNDTLAKLQIHGHQHPDSTASGLQHQGSTPSGLKMAVLDSRRSLDGQGGRTQSWAMCLKGPLSLEATATANSVKDCDHLRGSLGPQQRKTLSVLLSRRRRPQAVLGSWCANARIPKLGSQVKETFSPDTAVLHEAL